MPISCIFHAETGCTLDRSLRSVCNSYFCTGLGNLVKTEEAPPAAIIIANHDGETRMSPVITP